MAETTGHHTHVILYEWIDARGLRGALSGYPFEQAQRAKLDERLDRIEELTRLDFQSTQGLIDPLRRKFKKIKIRGTVALRPILVLGPFDKKSEITFLLVAEERDRKLIPSNAVEIADERLTDILNDRGRRRRYDRD